MDVAKLSPATKSYIEKRKKLVDQRLSELFSSTETSFDIQTFQQAMNYTLLLEGKRIRPLITIAVYELFASDMSRILDVACALELIHAGSLMLDDLPCMDDGELRRGKKTSHIVFGESVTILASACLWMKVFEILSKQEHVQIHELVRDTSRFIGERGIALGQYLDLFSVGKVQTLVQLEKSYELKTASLFQLAVKYGAYIGSASTKQMTALDEYARNLGIAFQIRDDIIDATQTVEESGKDAHKDEENHKLNYVSLLGVEGARLEFETHLFSASQALKALNKDTKVLDGIVNQLTIL